MHATYDCGTDIAWFRFPGFDASDVRSEHTEWGLRDVARTSGETVALEFWRASERFPAELLEQLPSAAPARDVADGR